MNAPLGLTCNVFIITFGVEADKQRILDGRPWLFDQHLLILKHLGGYSQPDAYQFDTKLLWLQLYTLPILYMNRQHGEQIGDSIDKVWHVTMDIGDTGWRIFLRIQVELNLLKSLIHDKYINVPGENLGSQSTMRSSQNSASSVAKSFTSPSVKKLLTEVAFTSLGNG